MPLEQTASWLGVLDLYDHLSEGWTLIGGQLVHLYCAERGRFPVRPTDIGFESAGISAEGRQHRWMRGKASIDVLLPDGVGERASQRQGVTGSPTLPTAGGTQALDRSEVVEVTVDDREGFVPRPNLVGALVVKAAAHGNAGDPGIARHRRDFIVLAGLITAADFANEDLTKKDRQRLRLIVTAIKNDRELLLEVPSARAAIERLKVAAKLDA